MTTGRIPLDFDEINAFAKRSLPLLVQELLPLGRREGNDWVVGNVEGQPGQSLHITLAGSGMGSWRDYAAIGVPGTSGSDPISLFAAVHRISQYDAAKMLAIRLGLIDSHGQRRSLNLLEGESGPEIFHNSNIRDQQVDADRAARLARSRALANSCVTVIGTPAAAYLALRDIDPWRLPGGQIGWHADSSAILYASRTDMGEITAVQRVFLNQDGTAQSRGGRKRKQTDGLLKGSAFILDGAGSEIAIVDGPEDALSVHQATGMPVRCAFGLNWSGIPLPSGVSLVLIADNDPADSSAFKAVRRAASNLLARGFAVKIAHPPAGIKDANDLLLERGAEAVKAMVEAASAFSDVTHQSAPDGGGSGERGAVEESAEGPADFRSEIVRLAKLSSMRYRLERQAAAEQFGKSPQELDKLVKLQRSIDEPFLAVELWPDRIVPADLLDSIRALIHRFIICDEEAAAAVALWVALTWVSDWARVLPILVVTAPEKRCGKTQLISLVAKLSCRPLSASNITGPAVYRVIEQWGPTLIIDEADTFLRQNSDLQGIINSGHTRDTAQVIRLVGDDHKPAIFSTFGCKAIAGIRLVTDTIMDRSVVISLRRKLSHERAERLRDADPRCFEQLSSQLARFAEDFGETISAMRPPLPSELNDRAQDNFEILLAIADCAGGHWPETARNAALKLCGKAQETRSTAEELLEDIRDIFDLRGGDRITTVELLSSLNADEDAPWASYNRGSGLNARNLAKLLADYQIRPHNIWMGHGASPKGYGRAQFEDAFLRYLPQISPSEAEKRRTALSSTAAMFGFAPPKEQPLKLPKPPPASQVKPLATPPPMGVESPIPTVPPLPPIPTVPPQSHG